MDNTYDLIVIGAGSGGLVAATTAHRKGLKTAMLEKNKIGGECTHYGCVPSKALIHTAKAYHSAQNFHKLGLSAQIDPPIFSQVMEKVDEIVHVGMTQAQAETEYGSENVQVFTVNASIDRFITDRKTGGMLKVIFNNNDLVVGAQAVGHLAGEWIQLLTIAIQNQIPAEKMADTIFSYPTYSEIVKKAFTRYLRTK